MEYNNEMEEEVSTEEEYDSDMQLDSDSDIDNDKEEDEPIEVLSNKIYSPILINPLSLNPATSKRWVKKDINKKMREHIDSHWTSEPDAIPHQQFKFIGDSPGPIGIETSAIQVFLRFCSKDLA
ncbi:hypothetical protein HDV02_000624, partial [Globomyces sp. JEL0801]